MSTAQALPRRAIWGLWVFFTAATIGFVVLIGGLFGGDDQLTLAGAGLMAFSTLVYLFVHFWTSAHASLSAASESEPAPVSAPAAPRRVAAGRVERVQQPSDANPYNFDGLLSHTLERVAPPQPVAVQAPARAATHSDNLVTTAPASRVSLEHIVPATQRRSEWIGGLPIIKQVLGEAQPVTSPARPGKTRGQCSNCQTILWAPKQRPIRLRCPQCGKVAWLEK